MYPGLLRSDFAPVHQKLNQRMVHSYLLNHPVFNEIAAAVAHIYHIGFPRQCQSRHQGGTHPLIIYMVLRQVKHLLVGSFARMEQQLLPPFWIIMSAILKFFPPCGSKCLHCR